MNKPFPVNLMTPTEVRALGWAAESRDQDGHLISTISGAVSAAELGSWIKERRDDGETITVWPRMRSTHDQSL